MPDEIFEEQEKARKKREQDFMDREQREAEGARLEREADKDIEAQNEEIKQKLAEGAKWPPPKRSITMGAAVKFNPKQKQVTDSIKDSFSWEGIKKFLSGEEWDKK